MHLTPAVVISHVLLPLQRFGRGDAGAGVHIGSLAEGAFTVTTLPNLAMSVPFAELRLHHQRKERADAAGSRAKATGEQFHHLPICWNGSEEHPNLDRLFILSSVPEMVYQSTAARMKRCQ